MASDGEISCTNDPNFAVIYSFLKVFGKLYGLEIPTIAKLQECIENTQEVLDPLKELHLRLLRRALKSVQSNRWERCLIKFCHQQGNHQEAWEIERFSYKKASTQVKLKVLKLLLEYQFTCHPKFKSAVNSIVCNELRLNPIGRDKNGCVYWYQVDDDANLCLYKEDQDEETWQLVARNREELVKVITQLKKGEDICPLFSNAAHEDSSSTDVRPQLEPLKPEEEENEEEFLSPETESENEELPDSDEIVKAGSKTPELDEDHHKTDVSCEHKNTSDKNNRISITQEIKDEGKIEENKELPKVDDGHSKECDDVCKNHEDLSEIDLKLSKNNIESTISDAILKDDGDVKHEEQATITESQSDCKENQELCNNEDLSKENSECIEKNDKTTESKTDVEVNDEQEIKGEDKGKIKSISSSATEELGEAIEEPLMVVKGEGNGADCESSYIGEEIVEEVMFFYGESNGYDNDTGNPEIIEQAKSPEENSDTENGNDEFPNGEHEITNSNSKNNKLSKTVKLKTSMHTVTKRSLKKQPNDTNDILKSDSKKHCIRNLNKSDSSNSKNVDKESEQKICVNDKSNTESESTWKSRIKKNRTKVKKKKMFSNKSELNERNKDVNNLSVNCNDSKTSIIEKRKSSVSSVDQEDPESAQTEKEKSPDKDLKVEEPLPPKKLRLESTPESDINELHSPEKDPLDVNNSDIKNYSVDNKDNKIETDSIAQRKKMKASKGKFKRKKFLKDKSDNDSSVLNKSTDKDDSIIKEKKVNKSLKRSLIDSTMSDKSKSESHSDSEDDEPISSGKRLKIRPKKIIKSSRKKVEAKLLEKNSTDESEEETLYSLAGKKASKKIFKKKSRGKELPKSKAKVEKGDSEDSDVAPVRQSRRIAQMKIKEEAERRHLEEVTLRELKMIHKKKNKDEEEWRASGASSSEGERGRGRGARSGGGEGWRAANSTGPDQDSDSDEPLFEVHEEPDLDFNKSDHEFSPESDLESGEPAEPLKRARTLQEGKDDGFCKRCGSGEQPEWILLCDKCDEGYHASCLKPMLFLVPEGDWFCPGCNHDLLIESLESELTKFDELMVRVEEERARKKEEQPDPPTEEDKPEKDKEDGSQSDASSSSWESGSSGAVYRLRARRALPVSYRAQEYDRLISSAIKEDYVEPTTSAGNQGRGKDISTIIEAAEEEKREAEREAQEQGLPIEVKKIRKKARRKPRKLNSLEVPSEDDDEIDEDFKHTGLETSSEDISSSAERDSSNESHSSDSLPIRRTGRTDKKDRPKLRESSPEVKKKKKGVLHDTSSESGGTKEWSHKQHKKSKLSKRRDRSFKKSHRRSGLTQYDALGNVIRARVTYGGLSPEPNDWSPKHRTRQKKINYTEMPNTESEDEMHKSSGKHMPDSSDEFKVDDSEFDSDSDSDRAKRRKEEEENSSEERRKALSDLIKKTVVVPLEKLPEDVTKAKTEELQAHLNAQLASTSGDAVGGAGPGMGTPRGRGRGRGRGGRGRGRGGRVLEPDDALAKLVGVKIRDLKADGTPVPTNNVEREKKRQEREAKQAEKEARRIERLQKKEEKEKLKEQKAKEREEKRQARIALQESKRIKKEKPFFPMGGNVGYNVPIRPMGPDIQRPPMYANSPVPVSHPGEFQEQPRFPNTPRLQVRAELRGVLTGEDRMHNTHRPDQPPNAFREGTLSVAGSPQPYKPITEEPSIITRMPHMINQQYRGAMMYPPGGSPYGPRGPNMPMYPLHPGLGPRPQYPPGYYSHLQYRGAMRAPPGPPQSPMPHGNHTGPPGHGPIGHGPGPPQQNPQRHLQPAVVRGPPPSPLQLRPHHPSLRPAPPTPPAPTPPPIASPAGTPPSEPFKIKAEVKTEPEYRSPAASPSPPEPPRNHPKIKHTENKDRRARYPLGPYAPQYGPYGPYAPEMRVQTQYDDAYLRPQYRPPYEPRPYAPRPPYEPNRSTGPADSPRLLARPPGPYSENTRPPGAYADGARQPGPYSENTRPPRPYSENARPPGSYPENTRPPGPYGDGVRQPGPYSENTRPPRPYSEIARPPGPYTENTRPPGPYSENTRPPRPYSENARPPGPYSENVRPLGAYSESLRPSDPYPESGRPSGPYADAARLPGPYADPIRPPGPYSESARPPGPYSESTRPPGPYPESARPRGPYSESTRPPGPYSESTRPPGPYSESVRPPGPYSETAGPPGPYSESTRPPGPYPESTRPPGPYPESARPPGPYSESARPPGPYSESPRPPGPYPESARPPGPYLESARPSGQYSESLRPPGPYTERPRLPAPFAEALRPRAPYTESPRPSAPYADSVRPLHPTIRERLEPNSPPRSLEDRPESRETPHSESSNDRVIKSPPNPAPEPYEEPAPEPVSLTIKPEPVDGEPVREEGSVFGGLVSYFSSQHEDDLDA